MTWKHLLSNSTEQSRFREVSSYFSRVLWNPKRDCCVHKSPPLFSVLSQINPVQGFLSRFLKIYFQIILSTPRLTKWSLSLRFPHQNPLCTSLSPIRAITYFVI